MNLLTNTWQDATLEITNCVLKLRDPNNMHKSEINDTLLAIRLNLTQLQVLVNNDNDDTSS